MTDRRAAGAAALGGGALFIVYVLTLAPSVTFWDAGEFIAAARTLGIPHPPGTPLFVLVLNVWARLFPFLPFAAATNLFSAACTAAACGIGAWFVARATNALWAGVAGALVAGGMSSVWLNATETEVYAASLLLSAAAIASADLAGRTGERRWLTLAAYLLALSIPLHLSAMVAAPVVILLASDQPNRTSDWSAGTALLGISLCVIGVSRLSVWMIVGGAILVWIAPQLALACSPEEAADERRAMFGVFVVACSALLFMLLRAGWDPAINQGNPSSIERLLDVVGRRQYDVHGVWPRQAPLWLQVANWFEYADWQFALGLGPTVIPTVWRMLVTLIFAGLGVYGAHWHRAVDRRTWRAVLLLFVCGTLGVIVYLNLKAGTSFGWPFVADEASHEARDRDYFFVLGFFAWGLWAGMGALAAATRLARHVTWPHWPAVVGVALAALPIALNWAVVDRRSEPEASMPRAVAHALLDPLPPNAVLFVSGDNDTYPLWYAQQVEGRRRDVTVVTLPLLGAGWYPEELRRRDRLVGPQPERLAAMARGQRRPVAVPLTVDADERNRLSISWTVIGAVAVDSYSLDPSNQHLQVISVDRRKTAAAAKAIQRMGQDAPPHPATDPVHDYFHDVLSCPRLLLAPSPSKAQAASLDSLCNLR